MKLPEYLNCPCYHEVVLFEKIRQFSCWFALPLLTRAEVFAKSKAVLTKSLEHSNYPCYHEVKISQKYGRFYEVNWKFALPVLCRDNIFPKRNGVRGRDIKTALNLIELYLMIMAQFKYSKNKAVLLMWLENVHLSLLSRAEIFAKNKTVLMMSLENSIYPCYHEVICPRKWDHSYKFTWKLDLPLLSRAEIFTRIKQFCWFDLKIWHGPIIASWNFRKNIGAVLLKWFENSHCLYYHELKFSRK